MPLAGSQGIIQGLKNGLLVSCQAPEGSPLNQPRIMAALAMVAEQHGALGVRINGPRNIRAVCGAVGVPVIGIEKLRVGESPVYITPTLASARRAARAGAAIVALDCTARPRPNGESIERIIETLKRELRALIMADVSTFDEGAAAAEMGADLIATTLHGYTTKGQHHRGPAFGLLRKLAEKLSVPVILEGRVRTPDDLRRGFELGAHAVVVGTAITGVDWLAAAFVDAAPRGNSGPHSGSSLKSSVPEILNGAGRGR